MNKPMLIRESTTMTYVKASSVFDQSPFVSLSQSNKPINTIHLWILLANDIIARFNTTKALVSHSSNSDLFVVLLFADAVVVIVACLLMMLKLLKHHTSCKFKIVMNTIIWLFTAMKTISVAFTRYTLKTIFNLSDFT